MFTPHRSLLALSLVASIACTVEKGDDTGDSTSDPGTDSASSAETGNTDDGPTTGINGGTDTGEPDDTTSAGDTGETSGGQPCIDTPQVLALDESSPLGFSPAELLDGKVGLRSSTLAFFSEPTTLNENIKGLMLPLSFELRHAGGEARFIDSEPNPDYDDSGNDGGFTECTDRIEIDVEFDFVTEAGEFDEHHAGVLTATAAARAELRAELMPVAGTFDVGAIYKADEDPPWVVNSLQIGVTWDGALAGGSLLNEVQIGDDEEGIVGFGPIAGWGDEIPF